MSVFGSSKSGIENTPAKMLQCGLVLSFCSSFAFMQAYLRYRGVVNGRVAGTLALYHKLQRDDLEKLVISAYVKLHDCCFGQLMTKGKKSGCVI